jgi:diguanylate cyclase (GGDEF)-like protein/PAS domain S-box-containing protein
VAASVFDPEDPRVQGALLEYASEFLVFADQRGAVRMAAGSGLELAGFQTATGAVGRHIGERIHPDDLPAVLDVIEQARSDPSFRQTIRTRARGDDDQWRVLETTVIGVADPVLGAGAVLRVRRLDLVEVADGMFQSLANMVAHGVLSGDNRGWIVFANDPARAILGLPGDAVFGDGWRSVIHADDLADVLDAGQSAIAIGVPQHATFRVLGGESIRWVTITVVPLGTRERRTGWLGTLEDVTDRNRAEADLAYRATHDDLTGLPNRALLEDRLEQACTRRRRGLDEVTLLFLDLDGFKDVNDAYGHAVGDRALREVASRVATSIRPGDTAARLGGDEFVILLEGTGVEVARALAHRVETALAAPIDLDGNAVQVRASIGLAIVRADDDARSVLARADAAMYARKRRA